MKNVYYLIDKTYSNTLHRIALKQFILDSLNKISDKKRIIMVLPKSLTEDYAKFQIKYNTALVFTIDELDDYEYKLYKKDEKTIIDIRRLF